jgi:hypothetical protein
MMMSNGMGLNYFSELRRPAGLVFTSQVINEYGELWWNVIGRGN